MKQQIIIIIILIFSNISIKAQSEDECKYLMVLHYLRTNVEINEYIKKIYPKITKKKDRFVEFKISNRVDFLPISYFEKKLDTKNDGINEEFIHDSKLYYDKYFFEPFISDFLTKLKIENESQLFLTFSKSIDNYLVVELRNIDPLLSIKYKFGLGLEIFFKFDTNGIIERVICESTHYL